ncbi:EAL domain-containing protein [Vreelandella venusta]|uniref:bifunctional diguanylate cyclase/phosphodiesterase n=1 Tax=Vreelandella venusta TaxID=44935 RepID=UPI00384F1E6D
MVWLLQSQYEQELRSAEGRAVARAHIVTEWVEGLLRQSDQALHNVAVLQMEPTIPPATVQQAIASFVQNSPLFDQINVFDAEGSLTLSGSSLQELPGSHPSLTQWLTTEAESSSTVLSSQLTVEDGSLYLYHIRRFNNDSGSPGSYLVARLLPSVFSSALNAMRVYPGENLVLLDENLRVVASHLGSKESLDPGRVIASDTPLQEGVTPLSFVSPFDQRDHWLLVQPIGHSLKVAISVSPHLFLAQWRQRAAVLLSVFGIIVALAVWGVRHYLKRDALSYRLQSREAQMEALVNSLQDLIFVFDSQGRFTYIHAIQKDKLLLDSEEILGRHYREVLPAEISTSFDAIFSQVQASGQVVTFEYPLMLSGERRYFHATLSPLANTAERFEGVLSVTRDITDAKQAEVELQIAAAAFQAHLGIMVTDARGNILKVNDTFKRITGYSDDEVVGKNPRMFSSGHHNAAFYRRLWKRVVANGSWEGEIWNQRKNGELFPEWLTISAVYGAEGELTHYVATMSDISERKAAEQEIHQLAFYDPLTGFANRRLFMDRVGSALKELNRHQRCGALLLIDIDNFNHVNDTLGYHAGDQLLQGVALRFGQMLRDTDTLARLGSDEFAVLIEGVDGSPRQTQRLAEHIARKLLAALDEPVHIGEESAVVTASVGVTIISDSQRSADDYLQQVDMALSQAKGSGRQALRFFDPSMQATLLAKVKLEAELRQALENQQWRLHYQPQVDRHGTLTGVEALLRWQHPERGMVSPGEFIPLLESTGLINDVGEWVLEEACQQLAYWAPSPQLSRLTISVNISPLQFRDADFLSRVEQVFLRTQAPLAQLKLEVTESLFVEARDDARDKMLSLKALGVRFSLDDFGTGYSSLAYLAQLPLDQLKIDQSFVQQVLESKANAAIVESTIALAKSLNLDIIAEGVETQAQQAWLMAHGCHAFQGYLFGRPAPVSEIEAVVSAHSHQ